MKLLSLKLPLRAEKKKYPKDSYPIFKDNKDTKYWITKDDMFCKSKVIYIPNSNSFYNEVMISSYLKTKENNKYINPPLFFSFDDDGNSVLYQKAVKDTDLITFINENRNMPKLLLCKYFLQSIKNIIPYLYKNKIVHNDFALENFMIDFVTMDICLIDFGLAEIYNEDRDYIFNQVKYIFSRRNLINPNFLLDNKFMEVINRDKIFETLFKKDMFSIGLILYSVYTGLHFWNNDKSISLDQKIADINDLHDKINEIIEKDFDSQKSLVLRIIKGLTQLESKNIISVEDLVKLIQEFEIASENKKRKDIPL